jgi:predicted dehydrogenase
MYEMENRKIGIGIIGGGYMGKLHSVAMLSVGAVFNTELRPKLEMIATSSEASAAAKASELGFARSTGDWRKLVHDPAIEAIIVATPAAAHKEMVLEAVAAGKHVFCEKPMGSSFEEATAMADAAESEGVANMVGYNYVRTPATQFAKSLIASGEIGEVTYFRCEHTEDFDADPQSPWTWRSEGRQNGTLGELSVHIINGALALAGPIDTLVADIGTFHKTRSSDAGPREVTNDDQVQFICRFKSGAMGHLLSSRIATGRKMGYVYEVFGTKGAIRFDQEDQNAVWLYKGDAAAEFKGFTKILTGPAHPDYKNFCLGPGHGTGFQDQIMIEAKDFLSAIATRRAVWPTFRDGAEVARVVKAAWRSFDDRRWVDVE